MTRARDIPAYERILAKLEPQPNGCWHWTGFIDPAGYGRLGYKGRRSTLLQRAAYDCFIGPVPEGCQIDHLCHTDDPACNAGTSCMHRRCGNPEHLEAVPAAVNMARGRSFTSANRAKTHCLRGHPFDDENTFIGSSGSRFCKACYLAQLKGAGSRKRHWGNPR